MFTEPFLIGVSILQLLQGRGLANRREGSEGGVKIWLRQSWAPLQEGW